MAHACGTIFLLAGATALHSISGQSSRWLDQAGQIETLEKQGDMVAAERIAGTLMRDLERTEPANPLLPLVLDNLAALKTRHGQYLEAEHLCAKAIALLESKGAPARQSLAIELNNLATLYSSTGEWSKAGPLRRRSLDLRLQLLGPDSPAVAFCYSNLAVDLFRVHQYEEAELLSRRAIDIWNKGDPGQNQSDLAVNTLALIDLERGNYAAALRSSQLLLDSYLQHARQEPNRLAAYYHTLALARQYNRDTSGADRVFQTALSMTGQSAIERIGILSDYAKLLRLIGRRKESKAMEKRALVESRELVAANSLGDSVDAKAILPFPR